MTASSTDMDGKDQRAITEKMGSPPHAENILLINIVAASSLMVSLSY